MSWLLIPFALVIIGSIITLTGIFFLRYCSNRERYIKKELIDLYSKGISPPKNALNKEGLKIFNLIVLGGVMLIMGIILGYLLQN